MSGKVARLGVRISYQSQVILCNRYRTREENERCAREALVKVVGHDPWEADFVGRVWFDDFGGKIEYYRELG